MRDWTIFRGDHTPHDGIDRLPPPPPWRPFRVTGAAPVRPIPEPFELPPAVQQRGRTFQAHDDVVDSVNAALYLRRPILVTGKPGSGKSSLIDAVAYELRLGEPLRWAVTSRSTLRDALYVYDAVGRLQERDRSTSGDELSITQFLRLGPLGTALLPSERPRALLIDEIDKADLDLPNDLLNVLEEGEFEIPELARLKDEVVEVRPHHGKEGETYTVTRGVIRMKQFPFVVLTSNGERDFPAAFLRRCLRLDMPDPCRNTKWLTAIVDANLGEFFQGAARAPIDALIAEFVKRAATETVATDQILNALFLVMGQERVPPEMREALVKMITRALV